MAKGIQENVKVPEITDGVKADFSTTTPSSAEDRFTDYDDVLPMYRSTSHTACLWEHSGMWNPGSGDATLCRY